MAASRTFVCESCGVSWSTDLPGRFTSCAPCKEARLRESRAKVCAYRNCHLPFQDSSPKNIARYCSSECGRREKAFRSGKAKDESYFRVPGGTGKRKCVLCEDTFTPSVEDRSVRCPNCRQGLRAKSCSVCGVSFSDDSLKNNRRYCDDHSLVGASRSVYVSLERTKASGLRLDDLTPFTTTWWGRVGESLVLHLHPDFFDAVEVYGNRSPYDLYDRELGKIAVKTAGVWYNAQNRKSWKFQLGGDARRCQTAFLLGFSEDKSRLERAWRIPFAELPSRLKVMSPGSKEYSSEGEMSPSDVAVMDRKFQALIRGLALPRASSSNDKLISDHALVGRIGERVYAALYPDSDHLSSREPSARYDFLDADGTKVNVRTRRPEEDGSWKFAVPSESESDVFFFLALDFEGSRVEAAYRVPVRDVESGSATVCLTASWSRYARTGLPVPLSSLIDLSEGDSDQLFLSSRKLSSLNKSEVISCAFRFHRSLGFPYPEIPTDQELGEAVAALNGYVTSGADFPWTLAGVSALSGYFPHRFESFNENSDFSAVGAFQDDERFVRALTYIANGSSPSFTRGSVRGALTALNRTPGQFPPTVAKELVRRLCPPGGLVFDPCAGWGGRLVGTLVAGSRYFGIDSSRRTSNSLSVLGARFTDFLRVPPDHVTIRNGTIEDLSVPSGVFDFAITSPPYWKRERYDVEETRDYETWLRDFLGVLMSKVYEGLKPGCIFVLNVSDYQDRGSTVTLVSDSKRVAGLAGFSFEGEYRMGKHPSSSSRSFEPLLLFRKPSLSLR